MKKLFLTLSIFSFIFTSAYSQISIINSPNNKQTFVGGTIQLQDNKDLGSGAWSSLSTGIATIGSRTGTVTGVSRGNVKLTFIRSGVNDTLSLYVAGSDSSGYYFEYLTSNANSQTGSLQLRDCDGSSIIAIWSGGISPNYSESNIGTTSTFYQTISTYNTLTSILSISFPGTKNLDGILTISIPYSKIKDFNGQSSFANDAAKIIDYVRYCGF